MLGELARARGVRSLGLERLSPSAVAALAEPYEVDAEELYRRTAGNAFFVSEALAAGTKEVPSTVRDAVLARAALHGDAARALLQARTVIPPAAEIDVLRAITGDAVAALDECIGSGMVVAVGRGVAFRHELRSAHTVKARRSMPVRCALPRHSPRRSSGVRSRPQGH